MDDVKDRPRLSRWARSLRKGLSARRIWGAAFGQTIGRIGALRTLLHVYPHRVDPATVARRRLDAGVPVMSTIAVDAHADALLNQFREHLGPCYEPGRLVLRYDLKIFEMTDCDVLPWLNMTVHRPSGAIVHGRPRTHRLAWSVPVRRIAGSALAVADMPSGVTNYYHFFEDLAVALRVLRDVRGPERVALLFSERVAGYQRPILHALVEQYPHLYLEFVKRREIVRADRLIQVVGRAAHPICRFALKEEWREVGALVRACHGIGPLRSPATRSVYLSRNTQKTRRLANEAALGEVFARHGCEIVVPEALGHADQVRLMAETRRLVAVGGATLVNMLFAHRPITVLEIFARGASYPFWLGLALQLGHRYRHVIADPAGLNDHVALDPATLDQALRETESAVPAM
jgi:capsular polysaccharide biosynthesis protein